MHLHLGPSLTCKQDHRRLRAPEERTRVSWSLISAARHRRREPCSADKLWRNGCRLELLPTFHSPTHLSATEAKNRKQEKGSPFASGNPRATIWVVGLRVVDAPERTWIPVAVSNGVHHASFRVTLTDGTDGWRKAPICDYLHYGMVPKSNAATPQCTEMRFADSLQAKFPVEIRWRTSLGGMVRRGGLVNVSIGETASASLVGLAGGDRAPDSLPPLASACS